MYSALWHVTLRQWKGHGLRVALTTLGIALGVAVFFAVRTANATIARFPLMPHGRAPGRVIHAGNHRRRRLVSPEAIPRKLYVRRPEIRLAEPVIEVIAHPGFEEDNTIIT